MLAAIAVAVYGAVFGPIKIMALGITVIALAYTLQIIYSMMDSRQLKHACRLYYNGTGSKIHVKYSKYVPGNVNVEIYADECQIASIYRDNEIDVVIPPGTKELKFIRRDGTIVGSYSVESIDGKCFYYYSDNQMPIRHSVMVVEDFADTDDESWKKPYENVCLEFRLMDLNTLFFGMACTFGPLIFLVFFNRAQYALSKSVTLATR